MDRCTRAHARTCAARYGLPATGQPDISKVGGQEMRGRGIGPSCGLYSYGPYSYGLYSYGLYSNGLYSYGLYSYGLYSYGLYSYGLYSYGGEGPRGVAAEAPR